MYAQLRSRCCCSELFTISSFSCMYTDNRCCKTERVLSLSMLAYALGSSMGVTNADGTTVHTTFRTYIMISKSIKSCNAQALHPRGHLLDLRLDGGI
jgi:hypothetical protein